MERQRKNKSYRIFRPSPLMMILGYTLMILYLETVFHSTTIGTIGFDRALIYRFLFSFVFATVGFLLSSFCKKQIVNYIISNLWLAVTTVVYIAIYLVIKQFKEFYDLKTMLSGAGGALTNYFAELLDLIFVQGGWFIMVVMALPLVINLVVPMIAPTVLHAAFRIKCSVFDSVKLRTWVMSFATAALSYILAILLVAVIPQYRTTYFVAGADSQYHFRDAVSYFGLLTGLRLDVQNSLFGGNQDFIVPGEIELPTETEDSTEPSVPGETTEPVIVYKDNVQDIDFEALNKKASSKIKKINDYVATLKPTKQNEYTGLFKGKNLIFLSAEAFSAELIDPELTPTLYRLANKGIQFTDYYQFGGAGTTGGEFQNLFGLLPSNGECVKKTAKYLNYYTMGSQLDRLGYYGKAYHNNSGSMYNRNVTHNNLGYSDGFTGYEGMKDFVSKGWPQSDYEMISGTLPTYIDKQPFNIYYMTVSGHNNYSQSGNSQTKKHWDRVQHLPYSDKVKGYIAANLDLEDALAHLVAELEAKGIADDTVICLSADHFPYGLDSDAPLGKMPYVSELYGYDVLTYFQRDHNRLILWSGCLEEMDPIIVDAPTFSLDILPTLSNLFGTDFDSRLMPGRDVFSDAHPVVFMSNGAWKSELGTYSGGKFTPVNDEVEIPENYVKNMSAIVRNKITYCKNLNDIDYFRHIYG